MERCRRHGLNKLQQLEPTAWGWAHCREKLPGFLRDVHLPAKRTFAPSWHCSRRERERERERESESQPLRCRLALLSNALARRERGLFGSLPGPRVLVRSGGAQSDLAGPRSGRWSPGLRLWEPLKSQKREGVREKPCSTLQSLKPFTVVFLLPSYFFLL